MFGKIGNCSEKSEKVRGNRTFIEQKESKYLGWNGFKGDYEVCSLAENAAHRKNSYLWMETT